MCTVNTVTGFICEQRYNLEYDNDEDGVALWADCDDSNPDVAVLEQMIVMVMDMVKMIATMQTPMY